MNFPSSKSDSDHKDETAITTTTTKKTLLSLHQDVWSECLKFLSPQDMVMASTRICKSLLFASSSSSNQQYGGRISNNEQLERASWLAIESVTQKADRILVSSLPLLSPSVSTGIATTSAASTNTDNEMQQQLPQRKCAVYRHPDETWIELYSLFWSLMDVANYVWADHGIVSSSSENEEHDQDDGVAGQESAIQEEEELKISNDRNDKAWIATCWLLFRWPSEEELPPSLLLLLSSSCAPIRQSNYMTLLGSILNQIISQRSREFRSRYRVRLLQSALRLSNIAGDWSAASNLLTSCLEVDGDNDDDDSYSMKEGDALSSSSYLQVGQLLKVHHDAEINICICTFLIDRMYSNTYVHANDSEDLSRAVMLGREAVSRCFQSQQQIINSGTTSTIDSANIKEDEHMNDKDDHQAIATSRRQQEVPPPVVLLYSSDSLRLAAACLALGKALALLAQHLGLHATYIEDIEVRPIQDNDDEMSPEMQFFREGEAILESSITRLKEGEMMSNNDDSSTNLALFEMKVATYAALGELYYCSASVESYNNYERMSQQTQVSIKYLTISLRMVQERLVAHHIVGKSPTVEWLCSNGPRSLILLQARTAKDLGKVYQLSGSLPLVQKGKDVLKFALAISVRLYFESHPSVSNIRRLYRGGNSNNNNIGLEDEVNAWINQNPLFERV